MPWDIMMKDGNILGEGRYAYEGKDLESERYFNDIVREGGLGMSYKFSAGKTHTELTITRFNYPKKDEEGNEQEKNKGNIERHIYLISSDLNELCSHICEMAGSEEKPVTDKKFELLEKEAKRYLELKKYAVVFESDKWSYDISPKMEERIDEIEKSIQEAIRKEKNKKAKKED